MDDNKPQWSKQNAGQVAVIPVNNGAPGRAAAMRQAAACAPKAAGVPVL